MHVLGFKLMCVSDLGPFNFVCGNILNITKFILDTFSKQSDKPLWTTLQEKLVSNPGKTHVSVLVNFTMGNILPSCSNQVYHSQLQAVCV